MKKSWIGILVILSLGLGANYTWSASNMDATDYWAWGENAGWLNFYDINVKDTDDGVTVDDDGLTGYVWCENIGWIKLDYDGTPGAGNTTSTNWGITNDGDGSLSGYAWGENVGWINFNPADSQVIIDSSGDFSGYAWSENCGWINFSGTVDDATAYNVVTNWSLPVDTGGDDDDDDEGGKMWWWEDNCFIATACFGTPVAEEVEILSRFRDEHLFTNPVGKIFVKTYYRVSPPVAGFIGNHPTFKKAIRGTLRPIVWLCRKVME